MKRTRLALWAASSLSAIVVAFVACGGGDDNAGDDSSGNDSGSGNDSTVDNDSGPPADTGAPETGPFCNTTPCVTSIGVGGLHSCAVISDGTVRCWGGNTYGALGSGTDGGGGTFLPVSSVTPLAVPGLTNVVKVAGGGYFGEDIGSTCALLANKTLDCWGFNQLGELGRGDAAIPSDPNPQSTLLTSAVDVSASLYAVCAVLSSGDITCWGDNAAGHIAQPLDSLIYPSPTVLSAGGTKFTHVSVGAVNACAITDDAHVWCWADPPAGDNGHFTDGGAQDFIPAPVGGLDSVVDVAVGLEGACAAKTDGSVVCWGANIADQLARGQADAGPPFDVAPAAISAPAGKKFTNVAAHIEGFCALADDSTVWCWGLTALGLAGSGMLDSGSISPTQLNTAAQVDGLSDVIQISSSGYGAHTCALIRGGAVKCFGYNVLTQLGSPLVDGGDAFSLTPLTVTF